MHFNNLQSWIIHFLFICCAVGSNLRIESNGNNSKISSIGTFRGSEKNFPYQHLTSQTLNFISNTEPTDVLKNSSNNSSKSSVIDYPSNDSKGPENSLAFNCSGGHINTISDSILCSKWAPINHLYFQLANIFLLFSYLAPNGTYGILYLRVMLAFGCSMYMIWGWLVLCSFDTIIWNSIFSVLNIFHALYIAYTLRPVKFSYEFEKVYKNLFKPLKVSRHQFKKILSCMRQIRSLKFQEIYTKEKQSRVDSLSLVISGRLVISQNGRALHIVSQHQFLDSPEWFGVSDDVYFQVTATAIEESKVLIWHRDKLKLSIINDQFLQAIFDHILGRDVVRKLMQVTESLNCMSNGNGLGGNNSNDKTLVVVRKNDDSCYKTTVLNRTPANNFDSYPWRLGRIDENDQETQV